MTMYITFTQFSPHTPSHTHSHTHTLTHTHPHTLTAGLHDPRVGYWEPAKLVAKLRRMKTNNNLLLFKCEMGAGHFSASGRFDKLKEIALEYAFLLKTQGQV